MKKNIKIGFIGYRGHATRLIEIFQKIKGCRITHFYHPEKDIWQNLTRLFKNPKLTTTKRLRDLYSCDAIIIASPNHTHFNYLSKLAKNYKGYIFCEKPPVVNLKELLKIEKLPDTNKKKIYFNFNMRFGKLNEILKIFPKKYNLGTPIKIDITTGHGLGFKKSYKSSWRAQKKLHPNGVLETLGIHFIDLISFLFGKPKNIFRQNENYSPYGNSIDTCHLICIFKNHCYFNLTCSYCMPLEENVQIIYTNGLIKFGPKKISVLGPRDIFNKQGLFVSPPTLYQKNINSEKLYIKSLKDSCLYFVSYIRKERGIPLKMFNQSILSNKICLKTIKNK